MQAVLTDDCSAPPSLFIDTTKEREPPSPPTALDFPNYHPPGHHPSQPRDESNSNGLYELLAKLKKPQDVSEDLVRALNLKIETDVKLSEIVPGGRLSSLPPYTWPESPERPETSAQAVQSGGPKPQPLGNGYPAPKKDRYDLLRREIMFENDDGFRAVARAEPRPGRPKLRVTHSRNLWSGLENVAQYWDTSLDNYIDKSDEEEKSSSQEEAEEAEEHAKDPDKMDIDINSPTSDDVVKFGKVAIKDDQLTKNPTTTTETDSKKPKQVYTGRRIGTGSNMPEPMREDTLRGFMEMIAWPFGCQVHLPSLPPRLSVKSLLFPVRHNFTICRSPRDRREARGGVLEGPVLVVQCRGETAFQNRDDAGTNGRYAEICDLLRETMGMLLLAQERAREGVTETKPGEGKWWTTEPRWGGAPNEGPIGDGPENSGKEDEKVSNGDAELDRMAKRSKHSRRAAPARRLSMAEKWKLIQPGPSLWDRKMRYMKIGKEEDNQFDDVSSLLFVSFLRQILPLVSKLLIMYLSDIHGLIHQPPFLNTPSPRSPQISGMACHGGLPAP